MPKSKNANGFPYRTVDLLGMDKSELMKLLKGFINKHQKVWDNKIFDVINETKRDQVNSLLLCSLQDSSDTKINIIALRGLLYAIAAYSKGIEVFPTLTFLEFILSDSNRNIQSNQPQSVRSPAAQMLDRGIYR